jgi:chromosome segregation ATPase
MDDTPPLAIDRLYTLTEASRLTGRSVDALRHRARRGKLEMVRSNDGLVRVRLTSDDLANHRQDGEQPADSPSLEAELADGQTVASLERELAGLSETLSRERARADRVERERDQARQEREEARVKAAGAEGEAKTLREALEHARQDLERTQRPFWQRWLGWPS